MIVIIMWQCLPFPKANNTIIRNTGASLMLILGKIKPIT